MPLAPLTWLRVGGPAELVFQPADADDLAGLPGRPAAECPVLPMGVASNLLVRDGGVEGVVVRFGGPLAKVEVEGEMVWPAPVPSTSGWPRRRSAPGSAASSS